MITVKTRTKKLLGFLLAGLVACSFGPAVIARENPVIITFPSEVEISGAEIYLGEAARIEGANAEELKVLSEITLGAAPRPGVLRWLHRSSVEYALYRSGWTEDAFVLVMPAKVKAIGKYQSLSGERMTAAVEDLIRKQASPHWERWWFDWINLPNSLALPPGEVRVVAQGKVETLSPGPLSLLLKIYVDDQEFRTLPGSVRLHIEAEVYIISQNLDRNQVLFGEEIKSEIRELVSGRELSAPLDSGKYRARRPLRSGLLLEEGDIEPVPEVCEGSRVQVSLQTENILLTVVGIARRDGWLGDEIPVQNVNGSKVFTALVTGPSRLEVTL